MGLCLASLRRRRREKHHESSSISPRTADVKQRPVICAVWASHRRAIYGAFETRVNPLPDRRKKKKGKTSSPLPALHVGADHRGDFGVLDILHRYIDMSAYRRFFVSTVLYSYLFAELDALRTCPDRCICVGTTVRCMFLKLQTLPRVPEDTTVLDLRYNNIREVPARSFEDLEQLETLLLNNNQIRHIEGHGFEGLRNLRHLYIFKNRIKYLDENSFAGLQSLEQLYLHDNLLQEIGEPPFLGLLSLERLFLNDNRIRTVHKGALQNLRQLRRLRLDNNPLTCDCSLMWFTQMLQEKQTITQATGHCSLPASLAGKPLTSLVESDFACERPSLTEEPYDVEAAFGVKINFSCKAEGEPRPSITWQHDGDEVSTDQDNRVEILDDGTLVIHSSRIEDIGTYKCRAENAAGHVVSRTAYLRFTSPTLSAVDDRQAQKPRIVTKPSDVSVTAGRSVTMRCQAAGRPTPQVTWTRDGLPLFQNPRYHVSRTAGTLIITATDLSDSGKYMCTASSLLGEESAAAVLRVERLQNSTGKGGRLIVTHCGNENGFVLGAGEVFCARKGTEDYHDEMDRVHYHKWFTQKLLPALPPGNVIFIDSAPFHSVKEEKVPCMSSLKKDIEARFSKKGVTWSTDMVKAELMKLVNAVKVEGDTYRIDTIASEAGHTVVRLPPYHC
ncbi:peroxidasin homolog [Ixodes scapularis]